MTLRFAPEISILLLLSYVDKAGKGLHVAEVVLAENTCDAGHQNDDSGRSKGELQPFVRHKARPGKEDNDQQEESSGRNMHSNM